MTDLEILNTLGFHPGTPTTAPLYDRNRADVINVALRFNDRLPASREKSLAFTALQEALMWANAAVAVHQAPLGAERTDARPPRADAAYL